MIDVIMFDVNGVLQDLLRYSMFRNDNSHRNEERWLNALMRHESLTGPPGTLDHTLRTECPDLGITADHVHEMFAKLHAYTRMISLVQRLKDNGRKVGILSDQSAESMEIVRQRYPVVRELNPVLFSPETGRTKKTLDAFEHAKHILDVRRVNVLIVDDDEENVNTRARITGWRGIVHTGYKSTYRELRRLGVV